MKKDCCKTHKKRDTFCIRKTDKKRFKLPRKFKQHRCKKGPIKGFTMKASCAPYRYCKRKSYKKN